MHQQAGSLTRILPPAPDRGRDGEGRSAAAEASGAAEAEARGGRHQVRLRSRRIRTYLLILSSVWRPCSVLTSSWLARLLIDHLHRKRSPKPPRRNRNPLRRGRYPLPFVCCGVPCSSALLLWCSRILLVFNLYPAANLVTSPLRWQVFPNDVRQLRAQQLRSCAHATSHVSR